MTHRAVVLLILALSATTCIACSHQPLEHAQPSAGALGREVLTALSRRDTQRLADLALDEYEFRRRVWPGLPAARPERNVPVEYVWDDLQQKSRQMLTRTLARYGGVDYALDAVRFDGTTTDHGSYRVHRDAILIVREATGELRELRVLGSMLEHDGVWKVFSYVVDD